MMYEVIFNQTIRGTVHAVNQLSAEAQFKWLIENKECFCKKHCDEYYKDYSVTMNPLHSECLNPPVVPKGLLVTPLVGSGGVEGTKYVG